MARVEYIGTRGATGASVGCRVDNGPLLPLPLRTDLCNHSPTGFCWGYHGSGPAQLALA